MSTNEPHTEINLEPSIVKEKFPKALFFEHLFPGNKWKELPSFNPRIIPTYIKRLFLLGDAVRDDKIIKALSSGNGAAERVSFQHVDKLVMAYEMYWIKSISNEKASRAVLWDMLEPGEKLGGVAIQSLFTPDTSVIHQRGDSAKMLLTGNLPPDIETEIKMVGILDKSGKPKGIILYKEGRRPIGGIKKEEKQQVERKTQTVPILIPS